MNNTLLLHGLVGPNGQGGVGSATGWTRPADWLSMPASIPDSIDILAAVFDHESNYCAVKITTDTGTYSVDWGDGTVDTGVTSDVQVDHLYEYADLAGTECTRGYRQALVRITPDTGVISGFYPAPRPVTTPINDGTTPWLDLTVNTPTLTAFNGVTGFYGNYNLERCNIVAIGPVTSLAYAFNWCINLQSVTFPDGSLAAVTSIVGMFSTCRGIRSITFPAGSLVAVVDMSFAFSGCISLESVTFPEGSLAAVTNVTYAFNSTQNMSNWKFPAGSLALVTNLFGAFYNSYCVNIEFPAGSLAAVTNADNVFTGCIYLESIEFPTGSLVNVTTAKSMFSSCYSLKKVIFPVGSLSLVTIIQGIFSNASSLQSVEFPVGALALVTNATNISTYCTALSEITNCTIPVSFTLTNNRLSGAALNEIYMALPTVVGQTVTVTGNHGTSADDPSIATAKGWTVVG